MPDSPVLAARALREELVGFEPERFSGAECATLAEELAQASKAAAAASARAAARAADCRAHRGFGDATDWLARISGTSGGQARNMLDTAAALQDCPRPTKPSRPASCRWPRGRRSPGPRRNARVPKPSW